MAEVTESVGGVSVLRNMATGASWTMIYAPGAGSNLRDGFGARLAEALPANGVSLVRFQFPYQEAGLRRPDSPQRLLSTWRNVLESSMRERRPCGDRRQVARRTHRLDARVGERSRRCPCAVRLPAASRPSAPIRREPNTCRVSLAQRCSVQARGICSPRRTNWRRRRRSFPERMCTCWMLPTTDSRHSSRAGKRGSTYGTRPPQRCSIGSPASLRSRKRETARRSCGRRCLAAASSPP